MKSLLFPRVTAIAVISCLLFTCKNKGNTDQATDLPAAAVSSESVVIQERGLMDVVYYVFEEFNARMVVPEAWMDETRLTKSLIADCDSCEARYIVSYTGTTCSKEDFLGAIDVYTTTQWNAIPQENQVLYAKVADVNGYVYGYRPAPSNPYDEKSEEGIAFQVHMITMDMANEVIIIDKLFPYTIKLDEGAWCTASTEEGGMLAQDKDGLSIRFGTSTAGVGHGLNTINDVKKFIIKPDKTAVVLPEPSQIGGFDAICYESNEMNEMESACVAYIQTGKEDLKILIVGGEKNQLRQIRKAFKEACANFQPKFF